MACDSKLLSQIGKGFMREGILYRILICQLIWENLRMGIKTILPIFGAEIKPLNRKTPYEDLIRVPHFLSFTCLWSWYFWFRIFSSETFLYWKIDDFRWILFSDVTNVFRRRIYKNNKKHNNKSKIREELMKLGYEPKKYPQNTLNLTL